MTVRTATGILPVAVLIRGKYQFPRGGNRLVGVVVTCVPVMILANKFELNGTQSVVGLREVDLKQMRRLTAKVKLGDNLMRKHSFGYMRSEKGITGLETAIILIAFVVVASVFAFTVLSTGVFSAERSKDTIYAGLQEARSSLEPRGALIAYTGGAGATPVKSVFKVSFIVAPAVAGEAIDLTPPYTADASSMDPDFSTGAEYRTIISYTDQNQFLSDVPWTVKFLGEASADNLLEAGEKAEITVWMLVRNYAVANVASANALGQWVADSRGSNGILSVGGTLLTPNDKFTLEVKPQAGSIMTLQRTLPPRLDTIMDLR